MPSKYYLNILNKMALRKFFIIILLKYLIQYPIKLMVEVMIKTVSIHQVTEFRSDENTHIEVIDLM